MTRTTKAQRQRRYRMAKAYLDRRDTCRPWRGSEWAAYNRWVGAFPKFMNLAYPGKLVRRCK